MGAEIQIFDIAGRMVQGIPPIKGGVFVWSPDETLGSGIYLIRAKIGDGEITKRIVYLK